MKVDSKPTKKIFNQQLESETWLTHLSKKKKDNILKITGRKVTLEEDSHK